MIRRELVRLLPAALLPGTIGWGRIGLAEARQPDPAPDGSDEASPEEGQGDDGQSAAIDEAEGAVESSGPYESPYRLTFKHPLRELLFDAEGERGRASEQSSVPHREWYSPAVRRRYGSWGVPSRKFECPPQVRGKGVEWRRERVVATATRCIGYQYQHHHVPDWDPPESWPWKECCGQRHAKGLDCSNYSGWNYNWALGIHLNTDVHKQAERKTAPSSHGEVHAETIHRPQGEAGQWYAELCRTLAPGDLLYIGNRERTKVTHVIMWVGHCAECPNGEPLVIDSTGGRIKDARGRRIPCGIHLRPFRKGSWYHHAFAHAHRWVR